MPIWQAILLAAVVTIGSGLSLRGLHDAKVRRHHRKLDDRLAAGEDRYFEELRELEAYDPSKNPPWQSTFREVIMLAFAFILMVITLISLEF